MISLRVNNLLTRGFCLLALLALAGCDAEPASHEQAQAGTPKERFARFEADLRRRCQEGNVPLLADSSSGEGVTSMQTVIEPPTCVLHEPSTPEGSYTAEVTMVTRLVYSSLTSALHGPEADLSKIKPPDATNPGLLGKKEEKTAPLPQNSLSRREEFRDTYDLIYRGERWELVTRDVPESMKLLLERALQAQ